MNKGFGFELRDGGTITVRRCWNKQDNLTNTGTFAEEVVDFTIETFKPYWSLVSLLLSPADAALVAAGLIAESTKELTDGE